MNSAIDPVRWARLLRRAHDRALSGGPPPTIVRDVVARSWGRAASAGVDPDRGAPKMLDREESGLALAKHPVAHLLPLVEGIVADATRDVDCFAALSDADGVLLWSGGPPRALELTDRPGFLAGHSVSEESIGTNAIGTALHLRRPIQIFSAEHFSRLLHGWTCSAAPIRDPESKALIGAFDLSGRFEASHVHSLALVAAVARVIEERLARELAERDERLRALYLQRVARLSARRTALVSSNGRVLAAVPSRWLGERIELPPQGHRATLADGTAVEAEPLGEEGAVIVTPVLRRRASRQPATLRIEALGRRRARVSWKRQTLELTPRHSELVVLFVLHPQGLSSGELRGALYGDAGNPLTVRAEVSRLRRLLGPQVTTSPYGLDAKVGADFLDVGGLLADGDLAGAVGAYRGALLPGSRVASIARVRDELRAAVEAAGGTEGRSLIATLLQRSSGT